MTTGCIMMPGKGRLDLVGRLALRRSHKRTLWSSEQLASVRLSRNLARLHPCHRTDDDDDEDAPDGVDAVAVGRGD